MKFKLGMIWICALALNTGLFAQTNSMQLSWLESRICPESGLVDAYDDGETNSPLYVNALAAIAFTHAGRFNLATGIFNTLETIYETSTIEGKHLDPGGLLFDQRSACQPTNADGNFRTGENAWLVMALNYYESVSGDQRYAAFATNLLEAICYYRDNDTNSISYGAFRYGGTNSAYSTEFQIDIYAALKGRSVLAGNQKYRTFANDLRTYLLYNPGYPLVQGTTKVWLALADPVFCGTVYYSNAPIYLDCQAWAVLALYPPEAGEVDFTNVLASVDEGGDWEDFRRTVVCDGISVTGFCEEFRPGGTNQNFVNLEWTEFVSAAYRLIGDTNRSDYYHQQVAQLIKSDGSLYHSCLNDGTIPTNRWPDNYRVGSADATSWYYFVENGVNPFVPPPARPAFSSVQRFSDGWMSVTFSTIPGTNYCLQGTTNLSSSQWTYASYATNLFGEFTSNLLTATLPSTTIYLKTNQIQEFFRIERK